MTNKSTLAQGLSHAWPWTKPIGSSPTTSRLLRYSLLCMLILLCGGSAWADDYYQKITSTNDLTDGEYLIVYEGDNSHAAYAFDGSLESLDQANKGLAVTIKEGVIAGSNTINAATFTIAKKGDNYTIKSASGYYIGRDSYSNGLNSDKKTAYDNAISFDNGAVVIKSSLETTSQVTLRYNYASDQLRFRYYKSGQQAIHLYKRIADTSDTRTETVLTFDGEYQTTGEVNGSMNLPSVTVKTVDGANTLTDPEITWASSNTAVATIEGTTISFVGAGKSTITASYAGDETQYKPSSNSFELTVSEAPYTSLKALQEAATGTSTPVTIQFNNVFVTAVKGSNAYLADADGYGALVYTNGHGLEAGNVLNGTINANLVLYKGQTEITGFSKEGLTITTSELTPTVKTIDAITAANQSTLVTLKGVTYDSETGTFSDGEKNIKYFDNFSATPTLEDGKTYDVTGIVVMFNTTIEICPRTANDVTEAVAPTPAPLYILGDPTGWGLPTNMTEMPWNVETQAYEYTFTTTGTSNFCFSETNEINENDWTTFNSTYRYGNGTGNFAADEYINSENSITLSKIGGDGNIQLNTAGTWTISVTPDMKMTITGKATEDTYVVAGEISADDAGFFITHWAGEDEANQMDKQQDGTYSITYENVEIAAGTTYHFKFVKNGTAWIPDGTDNNLWYYFDEDGTYNVTFTYDPKSGNSNVTVTKVDWTDPGFRDIEIELTKKQEWAPGTADDNKVFITVAEDGTVNKTMFEEKAAATLKGDWDPDLSAQYGWQDFTASVPVEGYVKITYATHDKGNDIIVTNANNEQVAKFNTMGENWSFENTDRVVVAYYRSDAATTLNFSTANYNPYFKVEKITEADLPAEESGFRDIKLDLTDSSIQNMVLKGSAEEVYITVAEDGTIGTTEDATKAAATIKGQKHSSYGSQTFSAFVPVEGCVKITYGAHDYGNEITVTNTNKEVVAKFNTKSTKKWMDDHSNVAVAYYRTNEPTTLTFSVANYNPYFAVEAINEADIPAAYKVTFAAGEGVTGVVPAAKEVEAGNTVTAPKNTSLYKEGYTLIGWESGNEVILPGAVFTPTADMTLTAKFGENEVSLDDREDAVTVTWQFGQSNGVEGLHFEGNTGFVVTQATVNGKTIDVKLPIDATNGKFFNKRGDKWAQVNANTTATVPACKGATISVNLSSDPTHLLQFGESTTFTVNSKTATFEVADDVTSVIVKELANDHWSDLSVTLPKVESTEPGGDDISGVFFSADVIATETVSVTTNTTKEVDASIATVTGGKMTIVNNNKDNKVLIAIQGNQGAFAFPNSDTFFKIELDHAIAVGDEINANSYWSRTDSELLGIWLSTATTRPGSCTVSLTSDTQGWAALPTYTVKEGDDIVGAKTIYVYRATGKSTYIDNITITRPAEEPVAEDVTATWDFVNNCANLATKAEEGSYTEETMASNVEGISMTIAYNGGQIKNNDNSYQVTNGVVMQIPVNNAGDEVTVVGYPGYYSYSIGGTAATAQTTTHKATADEATQGYVAVASTDNNNYINSITVTQYAPKPVGLKEKAIIDTDFQDWAKSSTTTEVTTKYTKENITFTYTNATVDPEATNEGKFPTTTDAAYKGYIMSDKKEATITTTKFASISKIRYRHGATGNDRGWGLKMKVGEGDWEIVSDATVGSTPAWIEKTIDKENVQLLWYNLNATQNAYMFELEVYAKVDLSNSPLLATLKANGTTYTADDIFEMGTDGNYAATIELASTETMPSTENPVEAVADNGEIGDITYDASNDQSIVTIPVTAGEASVNYVATFVRKPSYTLTYLDLNGDEIGTQQVEKDAKIGAFAYNIADVQAKTDGYKARGWFKNNYVGEKWTTESVITADAKLYAVETEIEVSSDSKKYVFDLTDKNFDANDHEAFNPTGGAWHDNQHGWVFANGDKIDLLVGGKASIIITTCKYPENGTTKITASNKESIVAVSATDGATATIEYEGEPGTLTLTFDGTAYIHKLTIFNTTTTNYEVNGDWIIVKEGDASSLVDAIEAAKEGAKIFLPNGTYDLGQKTLTTVGSNNVSIIGESMEGVIIKNRPTAEGISTTATLLNTSTGLYMQDLTLQNDWDYYNGGADGRAVCIQDKGTQTICKNVTLLSYQDTYYTNNANGEYYWETSDIHGTVDFICGEGTLFMEESTLTVEKRKADGSGECTITAPSTAAGKEVGYVFNNCKIENSAASFNLGRAWNNEPRCAFISPTYNDAKLIANRWNLNGMNTIAKEFVEYNPSDGVTENNVTFKYNSITYETNTIISDASNFTLDKVFTSWTPATYTKQVAAPKATLINDGKKITWTPANDGATAYAIFKDGKFLGITTGNEWTIEEVASAPALRRAEEPEKTGYTIRAANSRGGFGLAAEVSPATGISAIETELGGDVKIYDLNGRRVMTPTKGVYIINGKKVVIK